MNDAINTQQPISADLNQTKKNTMFMILLVLFIIIILSLLIVFFLKINPFSKLGNKPPAKPPTPVIKVGPFVEVSVDENGFNPQEAKVKKFGVVHFLNKTSKILEIVPEGENKILVMPLKPGKTVISFVLDKTGVYRFTLKNTSSKKGSVTVE